MQAYWYCYVVRCVDHTLYVGTTADVNGAWAEHKAGAGPAYLRLKRPVRLLYWERLRTKAAAVRRAAVIRRLPKHHKEILVLGKRGAKLQNWEGLARSGRYGVALQ